LLLCVPERAVHPTQEGERAFALVALAAGSLFLGKRALNVGGNDTVRSVSLIDYGYFAVPVAAVDEVRVVAIHLPPRPARHNERQQALTDGRTSFHLTLAGNVHDHPPVLVLEDAVAGPAGVRRE
jgi:hypothetical protein